MRILPIILLLLFACQRDEMPWCFTVTAIVEIQNDLYKQKGEAIQGYFQDSWNKAVDDFRTTGVTLQLDSLIIWREPDPYGNFIAPYQRLIRAWEYNGSGNGFLRLIIGKGSGGMASEIGDRNGVAYATFRWNMINYSTSYISHEIGHLIGATHDTTSCNLMNPGWAQCEDQNADLTWIDRSRFEMVDYIWGTCHEGPKSYEQNFNPVECEFIESK